MKLSTILKTSTLSLNKDNNGEYWLYDYTRKMNLGMRAKTQEDAFIDAIEYYQDRLAEMETAYYTLSKKVETFVAQFKADEYDS